MSFRVCTFNLGSNLEDYQQLCDHFKKMPYQDAVEAEKVYDRVQKKSAELLQGEAAVYCLQEVVDFERPFLRALREREFAIICFSEEVAIDTAIALDKTQFEDIENCSMKVICQGRRSPYEKDVAIAQATNVQTKEKVTFVSLHVPGFDFTNVTKEEARNGDRYCKAVIERLQQLGATNIQVIGADMNANPEVWQRRFKIFSKAGFKVHRTHSPTNVNPSDSTHNEREIDFVFAKQKSSIWQKIKSLLVSVTQHSIVPNHTIGWDIQENASDHLPVFLEVSTKKSKMHQLCTKLRQLFLCTR